MSTKPIALLALLLLPACEEPAFQLISWNEVRCDGELCFGRLGDTWTRVVAAESLDLEIPAAADPNCALPDGVGELRCIGPESRCFVGDGEWFAPFECSGPIGALEWPPSMCNGAAETIDHPWDDVGCTSKDSKSCEATIGVAVFEIWPDCYMDALLP